MEEIDSLNDQLEKATDRKFASPSLVVLEIRKLLAGHGIVLPPDDVFLSEEEVVYQMVDAEGQNTPLYLYISFNDDETGGYDAYAQIVDEEDLNSLLSLDPEEFGNTEPMVPLSSPFLIRARHSADD